MKTRFKQEGLRKKWLTEKKFDDIKKMRLTFTTTIIT